jgi:hypothetical protein
VFLDNRKVNVYLDLSGSVPQILQVEMIPLDSPAPMLILWVITFLLCLLLLSGRLLTRKIGIIICLITLLLGGIVFGGIPNVVLPIQETLTTLGERGDFSQVAYPIAILFLIIYLSFFFSLVGFSVDLCVL